MNGTPVPYLETALAAVAAVAVYWLSDKFLPKGMGTPLQSGPPEFITLAIIVSLGLYLRQVNHQAADLLQTIEEGNSLLYPLNSGFTRPKIDQLTKLCDAIRRSSPVLITLSLFVSLRIVCDCFLRFFYDPNQPPRLLYGMDAVITVVLFGMLWGLARAHSEARDQDDEIRRLMRYAREARMGVGPHVQLGSYLRAFQFSGIDAPDIVTGIIALIFAHQSPKLYDRTGDELTLDDVERIGI